MSGRSKFNKYKSIINLFVLIIKVFPVSLRKIFLRKIRNINGIKGIALRYILLKSINNNIGDNVSIHPGCYIFAIENLEIGNNVSIHPMCYIDATGGIKIGSDVSIAHGTTILSTSHSFEKKNQSIKYQKILKNRTEISDNVWIGAKAIILYGVKINEGSVIGAATFVNTEIPENSLVYNEKNIIIKNR